MKTIGVQVSIRAEVVVEGRIARDIDIADAH